MHERREFAAAVEVFARGFAFTRSFVHPYEVRRAGGMWWLRDAPGKRDAPRNEEWIPCGLTAAAIDRTARRRSRGRFVVSAIVPAGGTADDLRADFKARGYRLTTTEELMVLPLRRIPRVHAPALIQRVTTLELAERLRHVARRRQILPEHVTAGLRAPLRAYVALSGDQMVGWVRSIPVADSCWVSNLYVLPAWRRRGIGRALVAAMLRDDRRAGAKSSVLTASHAGAKLYPLLGYRTIGTLYFFVPRTR